VPAGDANGVRLIACETCHAQYDVSEVAAETVDCRCGAVLANRVLVPVDAKIHRCAACGAAVSERAKSCDFCGSPIVREGDPRKLSLICPECCARNANDARFCTACGVAFRPEPLQPQGFEIACPTCDALMPAQAVAGISVNECTSCGGLWVPGEHFDQLIARAIKTRKQQDPAAGLAAAPRVKGANPAAQRVEYRRCPSCGVQMLRRNFRRSSGVILDVCSEHGTWLDADELEQITGFILSGGTQSPVFAEVPPASRAEARATAEFARVRAQFEVQRQREDAPASLGLGLLRLIKRLLD
jgi:Zn-finger nucleic acid-binding protein